MFQNDAVCYLIGPGSRNARFIEWACSLVVVRLSVITVESNVVVQIRGEKESSKGRIKP